MSGILGSVWRSVWLQLNEGKIENGHREEKARVGVGQGRA
jgi:hypothetical protein